MAFPRLQATAVVRKNSIAFVEQIFALNEARRPLVVVASESQAPDLPGIEIDRCIVPADRSGWLTERHPLIPDDLPAQVTYTSGTEGKPKGILLTYANLADAAERIIDQMQMTAEVREYVGVPATFSFGMARYRAISAVGGQAYLPPRGFDPLELARMLGAGQVNSLSVVPTLLRILLAEPGLIGEAGKQLRWMEIGSQYMTADEKLGVQKMFPNALIVQHYGLTEASRTTFLRVSGATRDQLKSVGRPVGKTELGLSDDGRIRIRGPHVAKARIDADGLHEVRDADGWLQTNDRGHLRDGFLFFDGRADDLINCAGVKVVPDQLEERIRAALGPGAPIAVARVPDAQRGDGVLVAVQSDQAGTRPVREAAVAALQEMGVSAGGALHVMAVDAMPVTDTGKVQRRVLAERFTAQQAASPAETAAPEGDASQVLSLFQHEFPGQTIRPEDSFESLGGDSLHYIKFTLSFEQRFGQLPDNWEQMSVAELQKAVEVTETSIWRQLESITFARAFFMICIVALHTNAFIYSRNWGAAYFLVMLAGYSVARFQLPEVIRTGSVRTILRTIKYAAVPTILMVAVLQVATQRFEILPLLLVSNFLDPHTLKGFTFYFMEFYVQLLALSAVLFSFAAVRDSFRTRPMLSALLLLLAVVLVDRSIELIWNGDYNYHRTPWHYAWAFVLGMVLASANEPRTRLLALVVATIAIFTVWRLTSAAFYVEAGCALVLFMRAFVVPAPAKVLVAEIAGASMFIYLSHYQMMSIVRKIYGEDRPWLALISSIVVGIAVTHLYGWGQRKFMQARNAARDRGEGGGKQGGALAATSGLLPGSARPEPVSHQ